MSWRCLSYCKPYSPNKQCIIPSEMLHLALVEHISLLQFHPVQWRLLSWSGFWKKCRETNIGGKLRTESMWGYEPSWRGMGQKCSSTNQYWLILPSLYCQNRLSTLSLSDPSWRIGKISKLNNLQIIMTYLLGWSLMAMKVFHKAAYNSILTQVCQLAYEPPQLGILSGRKRIPSGFPHRAWMFNR